MFKKLVAALIAKQPLRYLLSSLKGFILLAVPLLIFTASLVGRMPLRVSQEFRYSLILVAMLLLALFLVAFSMRGRAGRLAALSITLLVFAMPLSALWAGAFNESFIFKGLIPFSDAGGYFYDAKRLLEGGLLSGFSARRPLFAGMLAVILSLTGQNLQVSLAILVAITGLTCFIAAREVQRTHGVLAGVLLLVLLFFFYRRTAGSTMTENLGLSLGALGFAGLWRSAAEHKPGYALFGLFLLTLALNARAGAFFMLLTLVVWGAWFFRLKNRWSFSFLLWGGGVVGMGFLTNMVVYWLISDPDSLVFSNFAYHFYGTVSGGKEWSYIFIKHPEINNIPEPERSRVAYRMAFDLLKQHPWGLVQGTFKALGVFLSYQKEGLFAYIRGDENPLNSLVARILLWALSLVALVRGFFKRVDPFYSMLLAAFAGILLSVPFATPWDSNIMRAYAPAIPFLVALPVLGLVFLLQQVRWLAFLYRPQDQLVAQGWINPGIFLIVFCVLAPVILRFVRPVPVLPALNCPVGLAGIYIRITPGSSLSIVANDASQKTYLPVLRQADYQKRDDSDFSRPEVLNELLKIKAPTTIFSSIDLKTGIDYWVIAGSRLLPAQPAIAGVCGKKGDAAATQRYNFFYAVSIGVTVKP